jgi:hypothetical protein
VLIGGADARGIRLGLMMIVQYGLPICTLARPRYSDHARWVNEIAIYFKASLRQGRAMADAVAADAVARGMSSSYYRDQDLRRPPRRLHPREHPCRSLGRSLPRKRRTIS